MNRSTVFLIVFAMLALLVAAYGISTSQERSSSEQTQPSNVPNQEPTKPLITPLVSSPVEPTSEVTTEPVEPATVTIDRYVESIGSEVEFNNARILLVNEGHVVETVYVTEETTFEGTEATPATLDLLEPGTAIRVVGIPAEGGYLATRIIVNPEDHEPERSVP